MFLLIESDTEHDTRNLAKVVRMAAHNYTRSLAPVNCIAVFPKFAPLDNRTRPSP